MTPQTRPLVAKAPPPGAVTDTAQFTAPEAQAPTRPDLAKTLPPDIALQGFANPKQAAVFFGCSLHHWRMLYRSGRVPPPIRLSERVLGWKWSTLIAFSKSGEWEG